MNIDTWALVLATGTGPLAAVGVTFWRDWVRERRGRRMHIYRTLMSTRRMAISNEHVGAINLIEVEFHDVADVETAWKAYLTHLNAGLPEDAPTAQKDAWENRRNDLLAILLAKIARELGITKGEIDIRTGGYAPQAWAFRDNRVGVIQDYLVDMAGGRRGLPVVPRPDLAPGPGTGPR